MQAEIISVGTEIILGQITNTNARYLADQLRQLAIEAPWQTNVDDDPARIKQALATAKERANLIFICGGLGPTEDDRTMAAVGDYLGRQLRLDEDYWQQIKAQLEARSISATVSPENIRQAYYLAGGTPLSNPTGLALGVYLKDGAHIYVVLPGPPHEFKPMVDQSLLPHLKADFGKGHQTYSALLHFVGRPESLLMQELASLGLDERLVVTSYVQPDEIQVRVTLHDVAKEEATSLLEQAIAKIARQEADYYIGRGAGVSMVSQLVALLKEKGLKITGAESLTGGLFQATLCSVAGASEVFDGGFVTYAASAKEQLLGVPVETVRQYGVVSKQTAEAMASGCQQKMGVDVGLSFTGVAGPDDLEGHPAGTVWLGLAIKGRPVESHLLRLPGQTRQFVRQQSVQEGMRLAYNALR